MKFEFPFNFSPRQLGHMDSSLRHRRSRLVVTFLSYFTLFTPLILISLWVCLLAHEICEKREINLNPCPNQFQVSKSKTWNWGPNFNYISILWNCKCAFDSKTWNWVVKSSLSFVFFYPCFVATGPHTSFIFLFFIFEFGYVRLIWNLRSENFILFSSVFLAGSSK